MLGPVVLVVALSSGSRDIAKARPSSFSALRGTVELMRTLSFAIRADRDHAAREPPVTLGLRN